MTTVTAPAPTALPRHPAWCTTCVTTDMDRLHATAPAEVAAMEAVITVQVQRADELGFPAEWDYPPVVALVVAPRLGDAAVTVHLSLPEVRALIATLAGQVALAQLDELVGA